MCHVDQRLRYTELLLSQGEFRKVEATLMHSFVEVINFFQLGQLEHFCRATYKEPTNKQENIQTNMLHL